MRDSHKVIPVKTVPVLLTIVKVSLSLLTNRTPSTTSPSTPTAASINWTFCRSSKNASR